MWLGIISPASGQNLLSAPESVVYDSLYDRYLASNWNTGHIVAIDNQGNHSYFVQSEYCRNGIHIAGENVYVACIDSGVKAFDLATGDRVAHIMIENMTNLNDITSDTSGYLYVSDVFGSKIYKIDLDDYTYSTFVDGTIYQPNGLFFDKKENRLLVAPFQAYAYIKQVNLDDSSVVSIVNTGKHNLDGLTQDHLGNFYFSTWQNRSVYIYDSLFTNPPELFYSNSGGPADIYFDKINNILAVPIMDYSQIIFLDGPTGITNNAQPVLPTKIILYPNYPNPFNGQTIISFELLKPSDISLYVYDIRGRIVDRIIDGAFPSGSHKINYNGDRLTSGMYFVNLTSGQLETTQKITLLK
jgi:hypothetical protein